MLGGGWGGVGRGRWPPARAASCYTSPLHITPHHPPPGADMAFLSEGEGMEGEYALTVCPTCFWSLQIMIPVGL